MYSKSPSRNIRSKGIKVKHILQICLLVAVCFWLIYQVKHSHEKKLEFDEKDAKLASDTQSGNEILRLGRKDISRVAESGIEDKLNEEDEEENEAGQAENRHEDDDEQETEEGRTEDKEEEEDTGKGGEDDEIDKRGEEKNEEEETVDEEKDREETDEKSEDNDDGEKEDNEESEAVLDDQDHEGGGRNTQQEREEHYKADDASSEVAHDASIISDTENATLKHTDGSSELIIDGKENVSQSSNQPLLEENSHESIEGTNSSDSRVSESMEHKENLTVSVYSSSENSTALTKFSDHAQVTNNITQLESDIIQAQNATSEDNNKEGSNPSLSLFSHTNTSDLASDENQLVNTAGTKSSELANTSSGESLNSSSEVKLDVAKNITGATETKLDDVKSADTGTINNPITNSENNVTGEENESSVSDTANDNVGADIHEHVDEFASSLAQEEKKYRTDPGTLPDIKVEVQNTDDVEAE